MHSNGIYNLLNATTTVSYVFEIGGQNVLFQKLGTTFYRLSTFHWVPHKNSKSKPELNVPILVQKKDHSIFYQT